MTTRSAPAMFHLDKARFGPGSVLHADLANLAGDYTYLTSGYYASLDAELEGLKVLPTTADAVDAYVVPISMEKATLAGLPVPTYEIVTDRFPPAPMLAYPINPFSSKGELLLDEAAVEARRKGLTYTGKYAVLVQHLPHDHRIDIVRVIMGNSLVPEYTALAQQLFEVFRLPLMRVRIVVTPKAYLLSAIEPLRFDELVGEERACLEGLGTWRG